MTTNIITKKNIERYRGGLHIKPGDLDFEMWDIFDRAVFDNLENVRIVPIELMISKKNQLEDPLYLNGTKTDPRQTAFERMLEAATGRLARRHPLTVEENSDGTFTVLDGNATLQVLMFAGWKEVAVVVKSSH